jgi:membrane associated rhomboid family serine protease
MMALWFFGGMVEEFLGRRRYLVFYLLCGAAGAIFYLALNLAGYLIHASVPGLLVLDTYTPLVGASAGVFGVLIACAYIAPDEVVNIIFTPIPLKLRTFAYGYVVAAVVQLLIGSSNAGGEAAHVGGAIAGYWFIRRRQTLRDLQEFFALDDPEPPPAKVSASQLAPDERSIDAILDKVSTSGLDSLSPAEREALRRHAAASGRA